MSHATSITIVQNVRMSSVMFLLFRFYGNKRKRPEEPLKLGSAKSTFHSLFIYLLVIAFQYLGYYPIQNHKSIIAAFIHNSSCNLTILCTTTHSKRTVCSFYADQEILAAIDSVIPHESTSKERRQNNKKKHRIPERRTCAKR